MKKLILLFLLSKKFIERKKHITFYQVTNGKEERWVSLETFQKEYKENQITKNLMGRSYYGTNNSSCTIKSTEVLSLSSYQGTKKMMKGN